MNRTTVLIGGVGLLGTLATIALLASAHEGDASEGELLTQGTPSKFEQKVGTRSYQGQTWPPKGNRDMFMVWPAGKPGDWVSYIHDRTTNQRTLWRQSGSLKSETYAQIAKDFGIETPTPWGLH